jgi:hypothetical protein
MKGGLGWRVKETVDEWEDEALRKWERGREAREEGRGWRGGYNMPLSNLTSTSGHSTLGGEAHICQ